MTEFNWIALIIYPLGAVQSIALVGATVAANGKISRAVAILLVLGWPLIALLAVLPIFDFRRYRNDN